MNQRDSQLRAGQRGNNGEKRQKKTWHPKIRFKANARICDLLKGQSSWTWMSVMLLLTLSCPVLAQPYPEAGTDVTPAQMRSGSFVLDTEAPMLSLVTCYPFGALEAGGPMRFVVTARMIF
jgi:hypothetical protein